MIEAVSCWITYCWWIHEISSRKWKANKECEVAVFILGRLPLRI